MAKSFCKLTRPNIRRLKPGESLTEHGITYERLIDGDGKYSVNIMVDGQRIHRVIGRESERTTRSQAEQFIEQAKSDARHTRLNLPKGRKRTILFKEASKKYLDRLRSSGGRDLDAKERKLKMHLVPFFGSQPIDKITSFEIERYKKQRLNAKAIKRKLTGKLPSYKDSTVTPGTVNRELAVLSHLFSEAVEWNWITHRPAKILRLREDGARITYLTKPEARKLVDCASQDRNAQVYLFVLMGLGTSMRLSEILSVRKKDVDVAHRRIFIRKAKAGAREQPITKQLADHLDECLARLDAKCEWLFPSPRSKTGHTVNINKSFRRVVKSANLDPKVVVRHTLRHTAITHLVQAGVDLPTVKRISGHKTLAMVERYAHANGNHIRQAMDKLEKRVMAESEKH